MRMQVVIGPVSRLDNLGDESIGSLIVRYSKQRLGEAHERDTLAVRQTELQQEGIQRARAMAVPATRVDHPDRSVSHAGSARFIER